LGVLYGQVDLRRAQIEKIGVVVFCAPWQLTLVLLLFLVLPCN
jgi:hypothetical protein